MRRRTEDRFVEEIFPIAGEFLLGDDPRRYRALPSAGAADDDRFADLGPARLAERHGRRVEPGQRLDEAEAGLLIRAEHIAFHEPAVVEPQPDRFGFGDQIADGQNEAIAADQDAVAGPFRAERRCGERIGGDPHRDADHARQGMVEIEGVIPRLRLQGGGDRPVLQG